MRKITLNNGYARVNILPDSVHLRFEQIDRPGKDHKFDLLKDKFYRKFPEAKWNHQIRWMIVPRYSLSRVLDFCYAEFGAGRVQVMDEASALAQLPLNF